MVIVTNELRSAYDEFLQTARCYFSVEDIPLSQGDMVIHAGENRCPKPVALKRLRRLGPDSLLDP